jgi:hypothetical protein
MYLGELILAEYMILDIGYSTRNLNPKMAGEDELSPTL